MVLKTPVGDLYCNYNGTQYLTNLQYKPQNNNSIVTAELSEQLEAYFAGLLTVFNLPIKPVGTSFQKRVWAATRNIPYGETITYKELAQDLGYTAGGFQAVAAALKSNPIVIVTPCHRVVGNNSQLVGYNGGIENKQILLNLENKFNEGNYQ